MAWIKLDPITKRRFARFRKIKRGYYSLLILLAAIVLSIFSPYLAESRALLVYYKGGLYFPTFQYYTMQTFAQAPPPAWGQGDLETDYLRLQREWQTERYFYNREKAEAGSDARTLAALDAKYPDRGDYVLMPMIPWDPYQSDFWYNEILNDIQALLGAGDRAGAERLARRDRLDELADAIFNGSIDAILKDPKKSPTGDLAGLARSGAMPSLKGLGEVPPTPPDFTRGHYIGTDAQGRDVASRLLYGFRISIFFALILTFSGQIVGTVIGSLQGYLGGRFDMFSQRIIEVLISIPFLYVVIILAALFVPSFWMLLAIMAVFQWITITFYMRTEMYREKTQRILPGGEILWRLAFAHRLPPSAAQLPDAAGDLHALRGGRRDLRAHRAGLSRLRPARADAKLGRTDGSGPANGEPRQAVADPCALRRDHADAGPGRLHWRIGARSLRPQAIRRYE